MADTEATTSSTSAAPPTVPFFKKKSKSSGNTATKKRAASPSTLTAADNELASKHHDSNDRGEGPSVVRLAKKEVFNPLKQATSNKRRKQNNEADEDDSDYELEEYSRPSVKYSDRNVSLAIKQKDEEDKILSGEAALARSGEEVTETTAGEDGLYKGKAAYSSQLPTGSQKFAGIKGPSSDIRTITLMDYQPDRCKDYAETGWCGFGDSCKFLHDRSDYKSGWEMDNSFLSNQPKKLVEEVVEEELPFACLICREPFGDPKSPHAAVVTRCGHYFGGSCAIKRYSKNSKCFACGASTQGIFNKADKILDRMEKLQQARLKKAKDEEGHDYDADENGGGGFEIEGLAEE